MLIDKWFKNNVIISIKFEFKLLHFIKTWHGVCSFFLHCTIAAVYHMNYEVNRIKKPTHNRYCWDQLILFRLLNIAKQLIARYVMSNILNNKIKQIKNMHFWHC